MSENVAAEQTNTETPELEAELSTETQVETEAVAAPKAEEVVKSDVEDQLHGLQRAKNKLKKEAREARKEAEELRKQLAEARKKPEPKAEDFDTNEDYIKAQVEYRVAQQTPQPPPATKDTFIADIQSDGARKYKDFNEVAFAAPEWLDVLEEMDAPEDIAYYLGKNPAEKDRLVGLDDRSLLREFTKIEVRLNQPKPRVSNTPPPVQPVEDAASVEVDEDKLSIEEWTARRNKVMWAKGKI